MHTKMIKINANTYIFGIVEFVVIKYFLKKREFIHHGTRSLPIKVIDTYPSG